jgi:hypothetical protein
MASADVDYFPAMSSDSLRDTNYTIKCYIRPGLSWSLEKQRHFTAELRMVAMESFGFTQESQLPAYQCLIWPDETPVGSTLSDKVIAVARAPAQWPSKHGKMLAFSSAILLSIPKLSGPVLHLGLTCVLPSVRSHGLTKLLISRVCVKTFFCFIVHTREKLWMTNVACVVSSLGSVAQGFDDVWPSPKYPHTPPSDLHAYIANYIARSPTIRKEMFISPDCVYDPAKSVFQGSVKDTVFVKERDDERYRFRNKEVHMFYESRIDWARGDEVLEVWNMSHANLLRFVFTGHCGMSAKL